VRIVGGKHRGRRLNAPGPGLVRAGLRPSAERLREALFDILGHARPYRTAAGPLPVGAHVIDAFAGTGALGLEALSRGARSVTFLELDRDAARLIQRNLATLGEEAAARVLRLDACRPAPAPVAAELLVMDPPYRDDLGPAALTALAAAGWLAPGAVVAVERPAKAGFEAPADFQEEERRGYGRGAIHLLRYGGD